MKTTRWKSGLSCCVLCLAAGLAAASCGDTRKNKRPTDESTSGTGGTGGAGDRSASNSGADASTSSTSGGSGGSGGGTMETGGSAGEAGAGGQAGAAGASSVPAAWEESCAKLFELKEELPCTPDRDEHWKVCLLELEISEMYGCDDEVLELLQCAIELGVDALMCEVIQGEDRAFIDPDVCSDEAYVNCQFG